VPPNETIQLTLTEKSVAQPTCQIIDRVLYIPDTPSPIYPRHLVFFLLFYTYFFFPLDLAFEPAAFELVEPTLDAREGDVELALLPVADFTLSRALF
jgi:hypothetical protein